MLNREQVIDALQNIGGVPTVGKSIGRSIYELAGPVGHFHIDYAAFPHGTAGEVPREIIDTLEREGIIERAYPDAPRVNAWKLVTLGGSAPAGKEE